MRAPKGWLMAGLVAAGACSDGTTVIGPGGEGPAAPRAVDARYFAGAVFVSWELAPDWDGDAFRVYSRRSTDPDFFLIAEVTSCAGSVCSYTDVNVQPGLSYDYFVAAVDPESGRETASTRTVQVQVPTFVPPAVPGRPEVVALDDAVFLTWSDNARSADDFSHYRVYLDDPSEGLFLLGETDSEGFLDLVAENGVTYSYRVSSVDLDGHESEASAAAMGTPRPDFHGEWIFDWFARPDLSGFRFAASEDVDPVVAGDDPARHFRLETDQAGWWLVPGPGTAVHPQGFATTALKCGPGSDAGCTALEQAPASGYVVQDLGLEPQTTYVLRVQGDDGQVRHGAIRVELLGFDQEDAPIMIFDWAYQLQPGNPQLAPRPAPLR